MELKWNFAPFLEAFSQERSGKTSKSLLPNFFFKFKERNGGSGESSWAEKGRKNGLDIPVHPRLR